MTLVGLSALYTAITGVPYFVDSDIPSAVFLGLHLLVTDPSTSPRTPFGRADLRRLLRPRRVRALCAARRAGDADLLRQVVVRAAAEPRGAGDRSLREGASAPSDLLHRLALDGPLGRGNLAHMAVWVAFFALMTTTGAADGMHTRRLAAVLGAGVRREASRRACERLLRIEASYCGDNAGWACNELGRHHLEGQIVARDPDRAFAYFSRACEGPLPGRLRQPARCVDDQPRQSAAARSAIAVARRRTEPARDAGAGVVSARLPSRLVVCVPEGGELMRGLGLGTWDLASILGRWSVARVAGIQAQAPSPKSQAPDFVEIPAGPFTMGADRARDPLAFDNERWSPAQAKAPSICRRSSSRAMK